MIANSGTSQCYCLIPKEKDYIVALLLHGFRSHKGSVAMVGLSVPQIPEMMSRIAISDVGS